MFENCMIARMAGMQAVKVVGVALIAATMPLVGIASAQDVSPEISARIEKEKVARRDCKVSICSAFAKPEAGSPIACDVTKTWTQPEILSRIVGGSYVWGYGHMQCSVKLNLDRGLIAKAATEANAMVSFAEHSLECNVDDKDASKGKAFSVSVKITPAVTFEKGEVKAVSLEPVKTEGSSVASAAVTSIMAVDKLTGLVSKAAAAEANDFLYSKCEADGVKINKR